MKTKVSVTIGGMEYVILTDEGSENVKRAAELVNKQLTEFEGSPLSALQRATLAALNIADDYYKAQGSISELRQQLLKK